MIEFQIQIPSLKALTEASWRFRKAAPIAVVNALRRGVRKTIAATKKDIRNQSGIGRTIWGARAKAKNFADLNKLVTLIRAKTVTAREVQTGIKFKGIPRLIEEGGRIKPHFIKNGFGRVGNRIPHPGMMVRAHGFGGSNLKRDEHSIALGVDESIKKLTAAIFPGASGQSAPQEWPENGPSRGV